MASASHIFPNCIGCKENIPNQHAHMHFGGGCLYQGDDDEEEEELKLNQVTAKAKAKSDKKTKKSTTKPNGRANNDHH